jgi:hypothetical protein
MRISIWKASWVSLSKVSTADLLAELNRRIAAAPLFSQPIPPPLYRERLDKS